MCVNGPDDAEPTEAELIARAQRDPVLFAPLYERNFDVVYAFIASRVGNRSDAEDVTSTVFHKALANISKFEWRGTPLAAWLVRIAANEIADRRLPATAPLTAESVVVEDALEDAERRALVFKLVRDLPEDQRRVLAKRFAEDRSIREVATDLGRSEGAVKQLQFRAFETLRARLGDTHV